MPCRTLIAFIVLGVSPLVVPLYAVDPPPDPLLEQTTIHTEASGLPGGESIGKAEFDAWYDASAAALSARITSPGDVIQAARNPSLARVLLRWRLLAWCDRAVLFEIANRPGGYPFLREFFSQPEWIEQTVMMAGLCRYTGNDQMRSGWNARAMDRLRLLHRNAKGLKHPVYQRLASVVAARGPGEPWFLINVFERTRDAHQQGKLHGSFSNLSAREMQNAVHLNTGAQWTGGANDRDPGFFDTLSRSQFKGPGVSSRTPYGGNGTHGYFVHVFGNQTPRVYEYAGGLCGPISGTGRTIARSYGLQCINMYQPQHFCYLVREGLQWHNNFDTFGFDSTFGDGIGDGSFYFYDNSLATCLLYETVQADSSANRQSTLAAFAAQWLAAKDKPMPTAAAKPAAKPLAPVAPPWLAAYGHAIDLQPLNHDIWMDLILALGNRPDVPPGTWQALAERAAKVFSENPGIPRRQAAGWGLVMRCMEKAAPSLTPEKRAAALLAFHKSLGSYRAPFEQQAKLINDPDKELLFLDGLLARYGADGSLLGWAGNRFAANPKTATAYARVIGTFFGKQGGGTPQATMQGIITSGLRKASEKSDRPAYDTWQALAARVLPAPKLADVFLNDPQRSRWPAIDPIPSRLLSHEAMLQSSSTHGHDRPLSYGDVLSGKNPGFLYTNAEKAPWAQVIFGGENEIHGVIVIPRYESPVDIDRALPLKISVSGDGKTWTEIATFQKAEPIFRVDLRGDMKLAKYIRAERVPQGDAPPPISLQLRNILVYGRRLY